MVRSAKAVKRHHTCKVSRKPRGLPKLVFKDKSLNVKWDRHKTLRQNMAAIGLAVQANTAVNADPDVESKNHIFLKISYQYF